MKHKVECQDPTSEQSGTTQFAASALPGQRELTLLKAIGDQGVVGSICMR